MRTGRGRTKRGMLIGAGTVMPTQRPGRCAQSAQTAATAIGIGIAIAIGRAPKAGAGIAAPSGAGNLFL